MLISDALITSIEQYDWHDIELKRFDNYDYDLWKYVAATFLGEYRGDKDYNKLEDYYESLVKKISKKLTELGDSEPDKELNDLLSEARLATILTSALNPYRNIHFSISVSHDIRPKEKTPEEIAEDKARQLIRQTSSVDYCFGSSFVDKMSTAISGLVNEKVRGHTFSTYLFKLIAEYQYEETSLYKQAGMTRQQFSKIRRRDYQPTKLTVFTLIMAMKLTFDEALELLRYAGYTFSPSSKLDRTIEFFIRQGVYNIELVNYILYKNELPTLGSKSRE